MLKVLVAKERQRGETRVAATPETVKRLVKEGLEVAVEAGAGEGAFLPDERFTTAGARLVTDLAAEWSTADVLLKVSPLGQNPKLGRDEAGLCKAGSVVI